jgi:hypothetical protein
MERTPISLPPMTQQSILQVDMTPDVFLPRRILCMVRGYLAAARIERDNPVWDDVFSIDLPHFDPMAMMQNAMCEVEKMMGIYPNVPPLIEKETGNPNDTQK